MNARYKSDKEPIELLLGMGGAVQYLEHSLKDESNYSVWVKTKSGNRQITIPIEAVQSIQSKKPAAEVIDSIKKQLDSDLGVSTVQTKGTIKSTFHFWPWLLNRLGIRS